MSEIISKEIIDYGYLYNILQHGIKQKSVTFVVYD